MNATSSFRWAPLLLVAVTFSSCHYATYPQQTAARGALIGAGTGALIGSSRADAGKGALIGAAVGAIAGGLYGQHQVNHQGYYGQGYYQPGYYRSSYYRPAYRSVPYARAHRVYRQNPYYYARSPYSYY